MTQSTCFSLIFFTFFQWRFLFSVEKKENLPEKVKHASLLIIRDEENTEIYQLFLSLPQNDEIKKITSDFKDKLVPNKKILLQTTSFNSDKWKIYALGTLFILIPNRTETRLDNGKYALNKLLKDLTFIMKAHEKDSSITNIPQVWLLAGLSFQGSAIEESVAVIGLVKKRVHELFQKPIVISSSLAVLIHLDVVNREILVEPQNLKKTIKEKRWWANVSINPLYNYTYPQFISLIHSNGIRYFKSIIVKPSSSGLLRAESGILQYMGS